MEIKIEIENCTECPFRQVHLKSKWKRNSAHFIPFECSKFKIQNIFTSTDVIENRKIGIHPECGFLKQKDSKGTPISKVRNLMQPIVNYFALIEVLKRSKNIEEIEITERYIDNKNKTVRKNMPELLSIIKEDNNWI